jgi:hypothetical protein
MPLLISTIVFMWPNSGTLMSSCPLSRLDVSGWEISVGCSQSSCGVRNLNCWAFKNKSLKRIWHTDSAGGMSGEAIGRMACVRVCVCTCMCVCVWVCLCYVISEFLQILSAYCRQHGVILITQSRREAEVTSAHSATYPLQPITRLTTLFWTLSTNLSCSLPFTYCIVGQRHRDVPLTFSPLVPDLFVHVWHDNDHMSWQTAQTYLGSDFYCLW